MAKAGSIDGIESDVPFGVAAARVLEVRAKELLEHSRGVLDVGDIERVHDMRVASRRLRAALEVFEPCFPRDLHRETLREVKKLADALGERRDRDVTISALEDFTAALSAPDRPGIESLVGRLREEQAGANDALAEYVDEAQLTGLRERIEELVAAVAEDGVPAEPEQDESVESDDSAPPATQEQPLAPSGAAANGSGPNGAGETAR